MTRGEIWKDFFKRTVLPAVIALFLFFMFKNVFTEDGQTNYFYVWLCCGIPFGIQSSTKRICSLSSFINFDFTSSAG